MVGYGSMEAKVEEEERTRTRMRKTLPSLPLLSVFVLAAVAILAVVFLHGRTQGRIEEVEFPKDNLGVINVLVRWSEEEDGRMIFLLPVYVHVVVSCQCLWLRFFRMPAVMS